MSQIETRNYPLRIDYDAEMLALIRQGGYDQTADPVNEKFIPETFERPHRRGIASVRIELHRTPPPPSMAGDIYALLAFGARYTGMQVEGGPIVATGSIGRDRTRGNQIFPCLIGAPGWRKLATCFASDIDEGDRYLWVLE